MKLFRNISTRTVHITDSFYENTLTHCGINVLMFPYVEIDVKTDINKIKMCKTCKRIIDSRRKKDFFVGDYIIVKGRGPNVHVVTEVKPYYLQLDREINELKSNCIIIPTKFFPNIKTTMVRRVDFNTYNQIMERIK